MSLSMESTMSIMIVQIAAMFLLMGVGVCAFKGKFLTNVGVGQLANMALYVANPAVIIRSLATTFDPDKLFEAFVCAALTIVFTLASAGVARLAFGKNQRISQLGIMINNMGFVGIPLVKNVLGDEYVFYVSVCIAAQVFLTWSYGVYLITQDRSSISAKKIFTNPGIIAVLVGVVMFLTSFHLDGVLAAAVDGLADLNEGLAMLVLGSYLAQADLRGLLKNLNMYKACALRLVVCPLVVVAGLLFAPISLAVKMTILIAFAAPMGTVTAIFPQMFGGDYRFGAGLVSSSTLLSLITMPLILLLGLLVL